MVGRVDASGASVGVGWGERQALALNMLGMLRSVVRHERPMSKPVIFTISATWDDEASVWSGHCDDIPAAADAPTLDELLDKISAMALDLLPDNHPRVDPQSVFLQKR